MDADLLEFYCERTKALSAAVKVDRLLTVPDARVERYGSPCGSHLTLDVVLRTDGTVGDIGYKVRACVLSAAATAIIVRDAIGTSLDELSRIRAQVAAMLAGEAVSFPQGFWNELDVLRLGRVERAVHGTVLLPFETIIAAVGTALNGRDGG